MPFHRGSCFAVAAALATVGFSAAARANVSDDFSASANGWTHVGDTTTPPTFNATGGNPGGYISINDVAAGQGDFFVAPAAYLGNDSAYVNGNISLDLLLSN